MPQARFRFHGSLNDFLPYRQREQEIPCRFEPGQTVKHVVESLGAPHAEVDRLLVNGSPVGFDYRLQDGDMVNVFPLAGGPSAGLVSLPQGEPRFLLDTHLGRLAAYLRMLGFDAAYSAQADDGALAEAAAAEGRVLLTRDRGLLKRKLVTQGYCLRSDDPEVQAAEVVARFGLVAYARPFRRCLRCNALLEPVSKAEASPALLPRTLEYYDEFYRCTGCGRVYWKGSHYRRMNEFLSGLLAGGQSVESLE